MAHRILLAGLFHETHTFLEEHTPLSAFEQRTGRQLFDARGDGSPLAGCLEVADQAGWDVVPVIDLRATPSGIVNDEVLDRFHDEFLRVGAPRIAAGEIDGIYLVLHGAMVCQSCDDVEGEIIDRIRALPGAANLPICGVLDLHGNISRRTITGTQGFVAYRCNPHTDACAAAADGARILQRILTTNRQPECVWAQAPIVWPPTGTGTADDPMRMLEAAARQIESDDADIVCVNVFGGFAFADTTDTGVSFSACTFGDPAVAHAHLERLVALAVEHRQAGNRIEPPIEDCLPQIQADIAAGRTPVIVVEPADNIGGGAPGDTTALLAEILAAGLDRSAVVINDPQAVVTLSGHQIGDVVELPIGATFSNRFCSPLLLTVELLHRTDGCFDLEDPHSHLASMCGVHIDMGPTAVVRCGGTRIVLTTRKTPPFDLGQLRSQGVIPEDCDLIGVKAAVAHRRAYDPITGSTYTVSTPGPCSSDLTMFPWRKIRRPVFPLDAGGGS